MPRRGDRRGTCSVCRSPSLVRIDWLLATGSTRSAVARKFNLSSDAVERHARKHISAEFRNAVAIGPYKSEAELRRLTAENSASVVENLAAIYGGLTSRWLSAFESGSDTTLAMLTKEMLRVLDMRARISRELAPPQTTVMNFFNAAPFLELQGQLLRTLAQHPEARRDVIAMLREMERKSPPLIEVKADAAA